MGALYEPDHLGKSLRITVKLRTGVADTADTLSTKETAFVCRSLLIYASKFRKVISARPVFQLQLAVFHVQPNPTQGHSDVVHTVRNRKSCT